MRLRISPRDDAYCSLARIFPTNVVVMRLLCRAKLILTPNRRHLDRNTLVLLLYTFPLQQGYVGPFTLDALKAAFMAERETRTSVRGEQLKAREEAVRMRLIHKTLKPRRRIPSSGQLVVV